MALQFEYFYDQEAAMYNFYRIPKLLITDKRFSWISSDAKILYGLMLERMGLSIQNNWRDEAGRVFIQYKIENIAADLGSSVSKAVRVLSELDSVKGIGLIRKVRRGQGRADLIYVMNYLETNENDSSLPSADIESSISAYNDSENADNKNSQNENSENENSENENSENKDSEIDKSENKDSEIKNSYYENSNNESSTNENTFKLISQNKNSQNENSENKNSKLHIL